MTARWASAMHPGASHLKNIAHPHYLPDVGGVKAEAFSRVGVFPNPFRGLGSVLFLAGFVGLDGGEYAALVPFKWCHVPPDGGKKQSSFPS